MLWFYSQSLSFAVPLRIKTQNFFLDEIFALYPVTQSIEYLNFLAKKWRLRKRYILNGFNLDCLYIYTARQEIDKTTNKSELKGKTVFYCK